MRDTELYAQILGVQSPWNVDCVDFLKNKKEVCVTVSLSKAGYCCPECGKPCNGYDVKRRRWRHLDTCQYSTFIEADVPRVECKEHGIHSVGVPWAEEKTRFTILLERFVIDLLHEAPISVVARWTGLSWSQVDGIQSRAVSRGLAKKKKEPVQDIGIDETSSKKGHHYLTIVHDKATGNVIHVGVGRNTETIDNFYEAWQDHLWAVQSVSMDLWPAFIGSARKWLKDADSKICFDRFHVAGFFGKAVDQVRKREHHDLKSDGNDLLKGTKYDWLRNGNNLDGRSRRWFIKLTRENLKTSRAWAIKETASMLWKYKSKTWAEKAWRNLFGWMYRSRLSPMINLAKSLKKHFYGIMNSIMLGIDNGMAESINSKIQKVKKMACGFRNIKRFQNAIMFHFGGLDLYPALPTQ